MESATRIYNKTRELYSYAPSLSSFDLVIKHLINDFLENGVRIEMTLKKESSSFKQNLLYTAYRDLELIIGVGNRTSNKDILWSIIHEHGHLQQSKPNEKEQEDGSVEKYLREKDAWEKGEKMFQKFEILMPYKLEYISYGETCLKTYDFEKNLNSLN